MGDLYKRFEAAKLACDKTPATEKGSVRANPKWERANDKAYDIAGEIVMAPARDVEEMLLKIRVVGFTIGVPHKRLDDLDHWQPGRTANGEEYDALVSLREDLKRLSAPIVCCLKTAA
ncbi:MAG: hypothetical protein K2Z80_04650 [Xanthobacteraceae bacterium]|nr:hypothetical protein [Xanthobacteraceae bacterium]